MEVFITYPLRLWWDDSGQQLPLLQSHSEMEERIGSTEVRKLMGLDRLINEAKLRTQGRQNKELIHYSH